MSRGWKIAILILLVVLLWLWRGSRGPAPDEKIAEHYTALCKIAEKGIDKPKKGVERIFRYYGEHGPELAHTWADLLVLIERIDNDRAHDDRARQAARRIQAPLRRCEKTLERFGRAVERDPEAQRLLQRGLERLSRTVEIIFSGRQAMPSFEQALRDGARFTSAE